MARDINFTRISRRDIQERKEVVRAAMKNNEVGLVDKNVDRRDVVEVSDRVFFNHVMLSFENNQDTNSCFFNDLKDRADSDFSRSYNIDFDPFNTCLRLNDKAKYGEYWTREIFSNDTASSKMNNFLLIVDEDIPRNSMIKYYLVTEKGEVFPIQANNKNALVIEHEDALPTSVRIKAVMYPSAGDTQVKIRGMALLYYDDNVGQHTDIFRTEFDVEEVTTPDDIITLIRDPLSDDALVRVESSKESIQINYDDVGELLSLDIFNIKTGKLKSNIEMMYENYTNSDGLSERVLTKIKTKNSTNGSE